MNISKQFVTYVLLGVFTNVLFYLLYLLITWYGVEAKIAMTIVSVVGNLQSYYLNKNITFKYGGKGNVVFGRYLVVYAINYGLNLLFLVIFVDILHYPHQIVQAISLIVLALLVFVLQRAWVFPSKEK